MVMRLKSTIKPISATAYFSDTYTDTCRCFVPLFVTVKSMKKHLLMAVVMLAGFGIGASQTAIANPVAPSADVTTDASLAPEIDTSITREYEPAIIFLPDPTTQELVPQSVLVTTDAPAVMAVGQIVDAYEGQDVGITGYEVSVNSQQREAEINFEVAHEQGGDAFQSLSSANQYSLFEAIRETLLTQPMYGVDEVIFQANDDEFNI